MRFTKMHGLGNDYVYVDCFRQPPPRDPAALSAKSATDISASAPTASFSSAHRNAPTPACACSMPTAAKAKCAATASAALPNMFTITASRKTTNYGRNWPRRFDAGLDGHWR